MCRKGEGDTETSRKYYRRVRERCRKYYRRVRERYRKEMDQKI